MWFPSASIPEFGSSEASEAGSFLSFYDKEKIMVLKDNLYVKRVAQPYFLRIHK